MSDIVLLGAGHAHLAALRHWRIPQPPVVVTRAAVEAYSGMVPAMLRGERGPVRMRLSRAVAAAGGRLVVGACVRIDLDGRRLHLADGGIVPFGLLSLDLGAASAAPPGAIPVRPASALPAAIAEIEASPAGAVAVVGAGAAGTELALALALRWAGRRRVILVSPGPPLSDAPPPIRRRAWQALDRVGVSVVAGRARSAATGCLVLADGREIAAVAVLWAAGLTASALPRMAGLACDAEGFVRVDACLRSVSHPVIFAAGDCAALDRPKSGALAVASGRALARNLALVAARRAPASWTPPHLALAIIGTGGERGLAWRGRVWLAGRPAWWLKWSLDRQWMEPLR